MFSPRVASVGRRDSRRGAVLFAATLFFHVRILASVIVAGLACPAHNIARTVLQLPWWLPRQAMISIKLTRVKCSLYAGHFQLVSQYHIKLKLYHIQVWHVLGRQPSIPANTINDITSSRGRSNSHRKQISINQHHNIKHSWDSWFPLHWKQACCQ